MRRVGALALFAAVACSSAPPPEPEASRAPPAVQRTYQIPGDPRRDDDDVPRETPTPGEDGDGGTASGGGIDPALRRDRSDRPVEPGVYRYTVTHATTLDGEPASYRSTVDYVRARPRRTEDGWLQKETVQPVGTTTSETITYRWAPGRVLQVARAQRAAGRTIACRFDDPLRVLDLPLRAGNVWREREPGCVGSEDGNGDRITFRVLRLEAIVVDRTRVRCFVIDRIERPASGGRATRTRAWFAPAYGLDVRRVAFGSGGDRTTYTLTNLTPYAQEA